MHHLACILAVLLWGGILLLLPTIILYLVVCLVAPVLLQVQWHLATGKRNYLPRLGGPLSGIMSCSSNPATYLVVQADNTVRVVNTANMTVTCSVHGLRWVAASQVNDICFVQHTQLLSITLYLLMIIHVNS